MFSKATHTRRCHRHHGFGPGFGYERFAPGGSFGRARGRRARRGDIRTAALLLLAEEPRNGYQIMQEVEERSRGAWRPSPGSIYPALEEQDGRKLFALTDAGRELLAQRPDDRPAPWEQLGGEYGEEARALAQLVRE